MRRPTLLGALVAKAAATHIAVRQNPERDWADAAMAMALLERPDLAAEELTPKDRKRLRLLQPLAESHDAWTQLGRKARQQGQDALKILLAEPAR